MTPSEAAEELAMMQSAAIAADMQRKTGDNFTRGLLDQSIKFLKRQ